MTIKKFFLLCLVLWVLLAPVKIVFVNVLNSNNIVVEIALGLLAAIITLGTVRRLGTLNYLEAMMVAGVWFVIILILDFVVIGLLYGIGFFAHWQLWIGYVLTMAVIFFFHKKRHVQIRKEQAKGHH